MHPFFGLSNGRDVSLFNVDHASKLSREFAFRHADGRVDRTDMCARRYRLGRYLCFCDATRYLGMDKNRINAERHPHVVTIRIGRQASHLIASTSTPERMTIGQLEERDSARTLECTICGRLKSTLPIGAAPNNHRARWLFFEG